MTIDYETVMGPKQLECPQVPDDMIGKQYTVVAAELREDGSLDITFEEVKQW